jgi:hypothetical protein
MSSEETPETLTAELVDKRDIAEQLLAGGIDERTVAGLLRMPIKVVQAIATFRQTKVLSVADQELAEAMRNLIWIAYEEALYTIQMGSPQDRIGLIKLLIARGTSMVGAETSTKFDEMRLVFEKMMTGIREPGTEFELPPDDYEDEEDVEAGASFGDIDD